MKSLPTSLPTIDTARAQLRVLTPADSARLLEYRIRNRPHLAPWEPARTPDYFTGQSAIERLGQTLTETLAGTAVHLAALDRDTGELVASCAFTNVVRGPFQGGPGLSVLP